MKDVKPERQNFFADVHEVVRQIPAGRVTSYGCIARYLGTGSSARMVGWAMNNSFHENNVPAHRVVNSQGLLTGKHHFATPTQMQELLEAEGVIVKNDKVLQFRELLWDPAMELGFD